MSAQKAVGQASLAQLLGLKPKQQNGGSEEVYVPPVEERDRALTKEQATVAEAKAQEQIKGRQRQIRSQLNGNLFINHNWA